MSDENRPNLNLGEPPGKLKRKMNGPSKNWVRLTFVLQIVAIACLMVLVLRGGNRTTRLSNSPASDAARLKRIAVQLEERGLDHQAAEAWEQYLANSHDATDIAEILFRVGKLHMSHGDYDRAAAAFVRCEEYDDGSAGLKQKIDPLIVDCFRRLGMYGEVGRELTRRVQARGGEESQNKVLARFAGEELTDADLDRVIQQRVDQMLAMQGAATDESLRQSLLSQFETPAARQQLFQEVLRTELFTRRAQELKLDQKDDFTDALRSMEQRLLANQFQQQQLDKIQPTDVDVQSFYAANQEMYAVPATLETTVIELAQNEQPGDLLAQIDSADAFRELATKRKANPDTPEEDSSATDGTRQQVTRGRRHALLGRTDRLFELKVDSWTTEPLANGDRRFLALVESKHPERVPPLSEIRQRVQTDYVQRKQSELSRQLMRDLMTRYQVEVLPWNPDSQAADGPMTNTNNGDTGETLEDDRS